MRANQTPDRELVRAYINGSDSAFEVLLNRHKNQVFTKIFMLVKDHDIADDIFQETFIKVINTLRSGRYNEEIYLLRCIVLISMC